MNPMGWYDAERGSPTREAVIEDSQAGPGILDLRVTEAENGQGDHRVESPEEMAPNEFPAKTPYAGRQGTEGGSWSSHS